MHMPMCGSGTLAHTRAKSVALIFENVCWSLEEIHQRFYPQGSCRLYLADLLAQALLQGLEVGGAILQ